VNAITESFDVKKWISENCITKSGSLNNFCTKEYWWENRNFTDIKDYIMIQTNWINEDDMTRRLYHLFNGITSIPVCPVCGNNCNFKNFQIGYYRICSKACVTKDKTRNEKISQNNDYEKITQKLKETNLEKYGVGSFFQTKEFENKAKQTKLERYGDENYNRSIEKRLDIDVNYVFHEHNTNKRSYVEISKELGCGEPVISNRMREAGFHGTRYNMQSSYERELKLYLETKNIEVNISDRRTIKNTEIDLYLPKYKLGIEINGIYWHQEGKRDNKFHISDKMKFLNSNGIDVINIWDTEYLNKKTLVHSIINNRLGINKSKIYARNCAVKEISSLDYRQFLEANHIQGAMNSSFRVGLYHDEILVSVMGVGKSRFKPEEIELHRFCNLQGTSIVGGSSKLFKYILTNYEFNSMISYCDIRWFSGGI
jgi:very-short-patch-repair endonuclease